MATRVYDRAYSELYLNNAMTTLATMLDYAVNIISNDIDQTFKKFVDSGLASRFENGDPNLIAGKSGVELYCTMTPNVFNSKLEYQVLYRTPEFWLGWSLAYYQWFTKRSFRFIHMRITLKELLGWYSTLHEADLSKFVEELDRRIVPNETNLEIRRRALGLSQDDLSLLSGVPIHTIQMYEQKQKKLGNAQWNILSALANALHCGVGDLMDEDNSYEYRLQNPIYQTDAFIMQLTKSMLENQRQIAKLKAEKAMLEAQRQAYSYGYVGQFPIKELRYDNGYYMPRTIFNDNWNAYWNGVVQAQNIQNQQSVQREIAKVGLKIIGEQAKQNNNHALAITTNAIGLLQADSLAEAISKVLTIIDEARKL